MERRLLVIFTLTVSLKLVQAKSFTCKENDNSNLCTITDVAAQDNSVLVVSGYYDYYRRATITQLTILNSKMDEIPPISSQSSLSLIYLSCVGCGLTDITKHSFTSLSQLVSLNISFGSYQKLQKNVFSQLPSLAHLNVSHGAIAEIDDAAFFNLRKLQNLDLSHNNISKITSNMFTSLESVWLLDLSDNYIEILDNGLFVNNTKLHYLDLTHNHISQVVGRLFNPQSVVYGVNISYNQLTTFNTENMENVWIHDNKIKQLFISRSVKFLNANNNEIENVTCDKNGSPINFLRLANNSLSELGCIGSLTALTTLYLSHNNLGKLNQSSFAALTELISLGLQSTNIDKLEYGVFSHQNKLQLLDISFNHMGKINLDMFIAARNLQYLYIDGNNITEFSYNDLKTAFISFKLISLGDNDFNCTFLAQAIKQLNSDDISAIVYYGNKVTDSHSINGIGCRESTEPITPSWMASVVTSDNVTSDAINTKVDVRVDAVIQQVEKLSQFITENDKKIKKLSEDINSVKQQNFKMNSDILGNKAEILKIEIIKNNNSTTSSNTMWSQINQLNNITLEKQQISNRVLTQEINEIKFEIEKNSHKISDDASKIDKLMKEVTMLQSSSVGSTSNTKGNTNSDFDLIKNVNIILVTLIVAFCIYKAYKFVKNDLPRVTRYNTANTLHTNIEMDNSSGI